MSLASLLAGQLRGGSAFLRGSPGEIEELFGSPAPRLPDGLTGADGVERLFVEVAPSLREGFSRWLGAAARGIAAGEPGGAATAATPLRDAEAAYLERLAQCLRDVHAADRRQGLDNLFWLAHSREIAEEIERLCAGPAAVPALRYRLHPLIAGLLRRSETQSRAAQSRSQRLVLDFRVGEGVSGALVGAIIDDQLSLTEADPRAFDPARVLVPRNPRFRIGAAAFADVGRAWGGDNTNTGNPGWLADLGFGLRIVSVRSSFGNVLHLDIAMPLNTTPEIQRVQFLVTTKTSF